MYKFTVNENYKDYSSGRVLYGATGATNFPVRLTNEIFQQCMNELIKLGSKPPYNVYDPFCGATYSLTVLGFLNGTQIQSITGSDVDANILQVAKKNLSLLLETGLKKRTTELQDLQNKYHKESHNEALESAGRLLHKLEEIPRIIRTETFKLNILSSTKFPKQLADIDLVMTDLPYGKLTQWEYTSKDINPVQQFLKNIRGLLNPTSIVALSFNKKQAVLYAGYAKLKSFKIGTRKILLLQPK